MKVENKMNKIFCLSAVATLTLLFCNFTFAQSNFIGGGDGTTWNDAANWDAGIPDNVNANIGDGFTVNLSTDQDVNETDIVGDQSAGTAVVNHTAGTLGNAGWFKVGQNAGNDGTYVMTGNATTNFAVMFVGSGGGTGVIDISDDAVLNGSGGFSGGLNPSAETFVTVNISDNAVFNMTDFNLGTGVVNQTGGIVTASSWFAIGKDGGSGTYNISSGTVGQTADAGDWFSVGESLPGGLSVSGDATVNAVAMGMLVGRDDGGVGTLEITGSSATINVSDLRVGIDSDGLDSPATGTLSWIADAGGISPITSADNTEFGMMDATLVVDLTEDAGFADIGPGGSPVEILLIDNAAPASGTFAGLAEGDSVSIGGGKSATISYAGGDGNDIVLDVLTNDGGVLGDVNCDGVVNLLDVGPFVELLANGGFSPKADIDENGSVNLLDVGPFVDLLSGG